MYIPNIYHENRSCRWRYEHSPTFHTRCNLRSCFRIRYMRGCMCAPVKRSRLDFVYSKGVDFGRTEFGCEPHPQPTGVNDPSQRAFKRRDYSGHLTVDKNTNSYKHCPTFGKYQPGDDKMHQFPDDWPTSHLLSKRDCLIRYKHLLQNLLWRLFRLFTRRQKTKIQFHHIRTILVAICFTISVFKSAC